MHKIIAESRLLEVLYENLDKEITGSDLYSTLANYFETYAGYNQVSPANAVDVYTRYITMYNKHCKAFQKTGKYPYQLDMDPVSFTRIEYDLILLLSVLFTAHRYRIMQLLDIYGKGDGKKLFVGAGPGIELELTSKLNRQNPVYDLTINDFLRQQYPTSSFHTEFFEGQSSNFYNSIFLIEILEHVDDPFILLRNSHGSLKKGGRLFITTATDIPQFDHLYNFPDDHSVFEQKVKELGYEIVYKEKISHNYLLIQQHPSNHFYILEKK